MHAGSYSVDTHKQRQKLNIIYINALAAYKSDENSCHVLLLHLSNTRRAKISLCMQIERRLMPWLIIGGARRPHRAYTTQRKAFIKKSARRSQRPTTTTDTKLIVTCCSNAAKALFGQPASAHTVHMAKLLPTQMHTFPAAALAAEHTQNTITSI
jgi:hypothetical protein